MVLTLVMHASSQVLSSFVRFPMDGFKVGILEMGLVIWGTKTEKVSNDIDYTVDGLTTLTF